MSSHIPRLAWGRPDGWSGLADGQQWSTPFGPTFLSMIDPTGAASVYGSGMLSRSDFSEQFPQRSPLGVAGAPIDAALAAARAHNTPRASARPAATDALARANAVLEHAAYQIWLAAWREFDAARGVGGAE